MKRQRGRGRKPGGGGGGYHHNQGGGHQHPNRTMESNGPEGKVRGPAALIYERYLQMARDAQSSGDRVTAENFLQHAEHYFRLLRQMQPAMPPPVQQDRFTNEPNFESEEEGGQNESDGGEAEPASGDGEQQDAEFQQNQRPQHQQNPEGGDDGFRRRRGRRNRYRPDGERPEGEAREEGGEQRAERPDRPERNDRPERAERPERGDRPERPRRERQEAGAERQEAVEGFSNGPKPAFLRTD